MKNGIDGWAADPYTRQKQVVKGVKTLFNRAVPSEANNMEGQVSPCSPSPSSIIRLNKKENGFFSPLSIWANNRQHLNLQTEEKWNKVWSPCLNWKKIPKMTYIVIAVLLHFMLDFDYKSCRSVILFFLLCVCQWGNEACIVSQDMNCCLWCLWFNHSNRCLWWSHPN